MSVTEYWNEIYKQTDELNRLFSSYWHEHSHMGTWQFWVALSFLVLPLILLMYTIDKRRIFEVFFFGFVVHMLWTYASIPLERGGLFTHLYFITPTLPFALNMTASALPIGFLLVYQYCTNHQKNFYLYTVMLSAIFAFGFASFEDFLGLVEFRKGMNQFYLFIIDIVIAFVAYWFTKFLLGVKRSVEWN
ncbi:hypothetical protein [Bacillus alkalicellulosilyticus]|uniref:hypothetical protein n=1 Tax=Alkalihalobacterium alkalicellulosilyticum TaxID=1912214 RepID=UPI0009961600|nr:hypothetical protein [Bacillus alkalicellulosilyticus]